MKLRELLTGVPICAGSADLEMEISGVSYDSRATQPGDLFVAMTGYATDGHKYIATALEKGAAAVLCQNLPEEDGPYIRTADSRRALAVIGANWFGHPAEEMTMIAVTGTCGKTTTTYLLKAILEQAKGAKVGLIGTNQNMIGQEVIPTDRTTPESFEVQRLFREMADAGCAYAVMETSSHALCLDRVYGVRYDVGIFTNLTRDHLDYHKTVENYLKAKKKFFDDLPTSAFALTNADDKAGLVMLQNTAARKLTYSLRTLADFKGKILESHFEGTEMLVNGREVMTRFVGRFNAYNLLAVYGAAVSLGKDPEEVLVVLSDLHSVSGRFQTIQSPKGYTAIVDYAHTPDALTNVLNSIHEVLNGNGRVITVVGCGGNRDKGKRPIMAKEAAKLSDQPILISDNPRFEEPDEIIKDMVAGLNAADMEHTLCITDRAQAIKTATMLARKGDVILVAGKGHEDYQEVKGVKHHFDDREQLKEIFKS